MGTFFTEFEDYMETALLSNDPLVILGDFNIHMENESRTDQQKMLDVLNSFGLKQHISFPTHQSGHTLDLVITRDCNDIVLSRVTDGHFISDHCFVHAELGLPAPEVVKKTISYRNIKSMDMEAFKAEISHISEELLTTADSQDLVSKYDQTLRACLDKHAPVITKCIIIRPNLPWYNSTLKDLKCQRRKTETAWRSDKTDAMHKTYRSVQNSYTNLLHDTVTQHYSDFQTGPQIHSLLMILVISSSIRSPKFELK